MAGEVIFSVFAGRQRFLSLLMTYVRPLMTDGVVDRVDVWDFCRLEADRQYLQSLVGPRIAMLNGPTLVDDTASRRRPWSKYYAYYVNQLAPNDLLIKCDDDIVFIANLPALISFARNDRERRHLLYYPSIVNNDVAAAFQAASGLITDPNFITSLPPPNATRSSYPPSERSERSERPPISDWFTCAACAEFIHEKFLARPADFATGCVHTLAVPCRVPINFFLVRGDVARTHFAAYARDATRWDDEPYLHVAWRRTLATRGCGQTCLLTCFPCSLRSRASMNSLAYPEVVTRVCAGALASQSAPGNRPSSSPARWSRTSPSASRPCPTTWPRGCSLATGG